MTGPVSAQLKQVPIDALGAALRGTRATWIGIQRFPRSGEAEAFGAALGSPVHDFSGANADLEDMLALLSLLDDYVGVSNANTHLRAGLDRPARVLIPFPPEWRWGNEDAHSPWFARTQAYRQSPDGDWSGALRSLG